MNADEEDFRTSSLPIFHVVKMIISFQASYSVEAS